MALTQSCALIAAKAAAGEWADLGKLDEQHRIVTASFIRQLLLGLPVAMAEHEDIKRDHPEYAFFVPAGDSAPVPVAAAGVRVRGAIVQGVLDLADCYGIGDASLPALALEECRLLGGGIAYESVESPDYLLTLDLSRSRIVRLSLKNSRFAYVRAKEVVIQGGVDISGVQPLAGWTSGLMPGADMAVFRESMKASFDSQQVSAAHFGEELTEKSSWPEGSGAGNASNTSQPGSRSSKAFCWVNLTGSQIGSDIIAINAKFCTPSQRPDKTYHPMDTRYGLKLGRAIVGGSLSAYGQTIFDGGLNLHLADIRGEVWLGGAQLIKAEGSALEAQGATLGGLFASAKKELSTFGGIYLNSAWIKGHFDLKGASLDGDGGSALHAETMTCDGDMRLINEFAASGPVRLSGSRIGGMLDMEGALLDGKGSEALDGSFLYIGSSMRLRQVKARGCIWIRSSKINNALDFNGARIRGSVPASHLYGSAPQHDDQTPDAISGTDLAVGDSVFLGREFIAKGSVRFQRARIEKDFGLVNASIDVKTANVDAVDLGWSTILGILIIEKNELSGAVRLTHTSTNILCDSNPGYNGASKLDLDGFKYQSLFACDLSSGEEKPLGCTRSRIRWLERMPEYEPQPYALLARVLINQGRSEDAREIMIEKHNQELKLLKGKIGASGPLIALPKALIYCTSLLFGWMFGFGLKPTRAIATIVVTFFIGWGVIALANHRGAMIVDQQPIADSVQQGVQMGAALTTQGVADNVPCGDSIRPSLYALDVFIPLVDLRQESKCEFNEALGAKKLFPGINVFGAFRWGSEVELYRYFKALYALAGWLIISLSILTFSGVLQRREEK